ncbi:unnamed protein product (macronuclear) [Paramecium tetraurelia]|uniref:Rab-GAP TBC domain-containing protein n=1 Tax=Paramecium tetraurelia TaxID=5888 RepID=A0C2M0_PARTE|nr:uncharacterized protein GSPATT00034515001 [Paramecium tetraurelia]CAK65037.1 unnamed protein product [Paramecium tetraurelia]|eukprot:XP_001432434.1 hypothetical protein (macronuclear) [Paramecium tetraurelia strain d4-2]
MNNNGRVQVYEKLCQCLTTLELNRYNHHARTPEKDITLIKEQINQQHFKTLCYSTELRKTLKKIILQGELHEMNYNWVLLELSGARTKRVQNPDVYDEVTKLRTDYPQSYFQTIQLDVVRTVSPSLRIKNNDRTYERNHEYEAKIERILVAYSIRNPFVSYCQGLNFITHFLVNKLKFSEEDTFWALSSLIEEIMPLDYYTNMISVMVDTKILEYFSKIYVPQLLQHFKEIYLEANFYAIQWFVCLFTPNLHIDIVKEIWMRVMVQGNRALIASAIAILFIFEKDLLKFSDFGDLLEFFKKSLKEYNNIHEFRFIVNQIQIKKKPLFEARDMFRKILEKEHEQSLGNESPSLDKVTCNPQWTVCNKVIHLNRTLKRSFSFFVYCQKEPCRVINDYWDRYDDSSSRCSSTASSPKKKKQKEQGPQVLLGRQFHICQNNDLDENDKYLFRSQLLVHQDINSEVQSNEDEDDDTVENNESINSIEQDNNRGRSVTMNRYMPRLSEQGYDGFYKQAVYLMKQQQPAEPRKNQWGIKAYIPETKNEQVQQKFRVARQSISSIAFATQFVQK